MVWTRQKNQLLVAKGGLGRGGVCVDPGTTHILWRLIAWPYFNIYGIKTFVNMHSSRGSGTLNLGTLIRVVIREEELETVCPDYRGLLSHSNFFTDVADKVMVFGFMKGLHFIMTWWGHGKYGLVHVPPERASSGWLFIIFKLVTSNLTRIEFVIQLLGTLISVT